MIDLTTGLIGATPEFGIMP